MYGPKIKEILESKDIENGDRIRVKGYEGRLMPKPESGDPDSIVLKLDSGYNIGLEPEDVELVEKNTRETPEKQELEHKDDKPDILILHTGGTIASRVSYEEGGVKPAFDPEDLLEMYPEVAEECNIHSEVVAQMLSEDMEPGHWQKIAEKIDEVKDDYDGIIVGHGTDTLGYTGPALTLMLQDIDTGVLIVGSQRSSDRPSSDAAMNMYCAARFLKKTDFNGVGVCMHETVSDKRCVILPASNARKMHTSRRDAFKPVNTGALGFVDYSSGKVVAQFENSSGDYSLNTELNPDVGFLKARPGMRPEELDFLKAQDYDGIVIEGTGLGHMPVNSFDELTEHHEDILEKLGDLSKDAVVVMASQCINGRVNMNVYDAGLKIQEAGVLGSGNMHPELAYVKLMWALGNADSREDALDLFKKDVCGETSARTIYRGE